jgi:carboxylate-amine ligase
MDAVFYDFDAGSEVGARDLARDLVRSLRPISQDLRCEAELEGILEVVDGDNAAEAQRASFERSGSLEGVVDDLVAATA